MKSLITLSTFFLIRTPDTSLGFELTYNSSYKIINKIMSTTHLSMYLLKPWVSCLVPVSMDKFSVVTHLTINLSNLFFLTDPPFYLLCIYLSRSIREFLFYGRLLWFFSSVTLSLGVRQSQRYFVERNPTFWWNIYSCLCASPGPRVLS